MMWRALVTMVALACLAGPAAATCPSSETILSDLTCSSTVSGRVSNSGSSDLGGTCAAGDCYTCGSPYANLPQSEAEDVYSFTCQHSGDVTLEISGLDCDLDIYVLDDTCDPYGGCTDGSTEASTTTDSVTFTCGAGDTYYVVIEGYGFGAAGPGRCNGGSDGDYTLTFDVTAGTGCSEDCDNGLDDDLDSDIDCDDSDCAADPVCATCADADGDGYDDDACGGTDCDDTDDTVYPGGPELCDGVDNDCDGTVDEGSGVTWYADDDSDGYGDASSTTTSCSAPSGYVASATDCDDTDSAVYPGATEYCDGVDNDCDGVVDEDAAVDAVTWYADGDGDGDGDPEVTDVGCSAASGYVANNDDCYDGDSSVHTGGVETADGIDDDCDGVVDEGTSAYDDDGDGVAEDGGDCDDAASDVSPATVETCDGEDDDCDGLVDETTDCYDDDGDGATEDEGDCHDGDVAIGPARSEIADNGIDDDCDGAVDGGVYDPDGDGFTEGGGDCDDADGASYPGAPEQADGVDNDCDGVTDEGTSAGDDDGDGFSEDDGDCNDADASTDPDASEVSDGIDNDCDGAVDEGSTRTDDDGDGFSEEAGDCDDTRAEVVPGGVETANGVDDDCDGVVDDGAADADGDGWSVADGDCDDQDGWAGPGRAEVCDGIDNDCNGDVDEGCMDEGTGTGKAGECGCASGAGGAGIVPLLLALIAVTRRRGSVALLALITLGACARDVSVTKVPPTLTVQPELIDFGTVVVGSTASDEVSVIHVGGEDAQVRSVDLVGDYFALGGEMPDVPRDGSAVLPIVYTPLEEGWHEGTVTITYNNPDEPSLTVAVRGHAVSAHATLLPGVLDFGVVPAGTSASRSLVLQNDGDTILTLSSVTFGDPAFSFATSTGQGVDAGASISLPIRYTAADDAPISSTATVDVDSITLSAVILRANDCEGGAPEAYDVDEDGFTSCGGDCDDADGAVHPGGSETADGTDEDCDQVIDEGTSAYDDDGDGASEDEGDCSDGDASVNTAANETDGNGVDDDCDGVIDQGTADGDTDGYSVDGGDCDDGDVTVHPGADELANGGDDDCDGTTDEGTTAYDDDRDGYTEAAGDCDDSDAAISPGDAEVADHADNDCDGDVDEGTTYADDDGDGFTDAGGDCDDTDATVSPAAAEVARDGVDNDCDGVVG